MEEEFILSQPNKAYRQLAMPLVFFAIFSAFYNFIDIFWASVVGSDTLVAIGISAPIFLVIYYLGKNIGQGTNAVMSRFQGAYNLEQTRNTLLHGILICICISLIIPFILFFSLNGLLDFIGVSSTICTLITSYLLPLSLFAFIFIFTLFFAETIISEGDSKRPTIFLIIGNIVNLILDPILGITLGFGIVGLAYASIIGSLIPFFQLIHIYYKNTKIKIVWDDFKFDYEIILEIFKVALPNMVDTFMFSVLGIAMNTILIFSIGPIGVSMYVLFDTLRELVTSPTRGGARGLLTIVGHLYGAKDMSKVKSLFKYSFKYEYVMNIISIIIFVVIFIIMLFFFKNILSYLVSDFSNSQLFKMILLLIIACTIIPICYICSHILNGLGKSIYSLLNTILNIILMVGFSYLLTNYLHLGAYGVLIGIIIGEIIVASLYILTTQKIIKNIENKYMNSGM